MNRNYLIAGGAAIAIYFLFFRKKKDSVKPEKKQQVGGGGGGGFSPMGVPVSEKDETPNEGGTKVVSTGTGTQVIKGQSDVVIKGDRPSPYRGGMPDVTVRPNTNTDTKTQVSGGNVVSTAKPTSGAITLPKPKTQTTYDPLPTVNISQQKAGGAIKMPSLGGRGGVVPVSQGGSRVPLGGANVKLQPNMMFTGDTEFADFVVTVSRADFN